MACHEFLKIDIHLDTKVVQNAAVTRDCQVGGPWVLVNLHRLVEDWDYFVFGVQWRLSIFFLCRFFCIFGHTFVSYKKAFDFFLIFIMCSFDSLAMSSL